MNQAWEQQWAWVSPCWCCGSPWVASSLARLLLPGPDPMSWFTTIGYGIGGSLLGGLVARLLGLPEGLSFVLAVASAALLIWFFRRRNAAKTLGNEHK